MPAEAIYLGKKILCKPLLGQPEQEHNISREEMASMSKGPTVPQIIINDLPIGGFEDLIQLFNTEAFK